MNNNYYQPARDFIPVVGQDAETVLAYNQMMDRISSEPTDGMIDLFIIPKTEEDLQLFKAHNELVRSYQNKHGLSFQPVLVPVVPQQQYYTPEQALNRPLFHEYKPHNQPTDLEMARLFIYREQVRTRNGSVYLYNGKYYKKVNDDQLKSKILSVLRGELEIKGNSKQLETVAAAIKAEPDIQVHEENLPVRGLCLRNCVIDIASMTCSDHNPQFFFTMQLQVDYQGSQPTPVMDRFLYQIAGGDPVLIKRIWQVIGYCLVPQDNRAKRFFLFQGLGNTGKSVLGSLLTSFYEESAVGSVDAFRLGDRFSLSALASKAVNISMDLSSSALGDQAVGIIKQMAGNDLVQVEEKYKAPYATRVGCKLIFGTNHQLRTTTFDAAFLRRICLVIFNHVVPKYQQDPYLLDKLKLEKSGIFYKAMEAYRELVASNYTFAGDDIYDMVNAKQAGEQPVDHETCIEAFIERHVVAMFDGFVPTEELHMFYLSENPNGLSDRQKFSARFKQLAAKKGLVAVNKKKRVNGEPANGYEGIALV